MRIRLLPAIAVLLLQSCGEPTQVMSAEFSSMTGCVAGIKRNSGQDLNIIIDKPDTVSGRLADGRSFACMAQTSGTKGAYVEGFFDVE